MFGNERDVEVPALLRFIDEMQPSSLLDVGAHSTAHTYAPALRKRMKDRPYWAIDLADDRETAAIVDRYIVGDLTKAHGIEPAGVVTCVSVIEHAAEKFGGDMLALVSKLLSFARDGLFVTFPYGKEGSVPNEYRNITSGDLNAICTLMAEAGLLPSHEFTVSDTPLLGRDAWYWTTERHAASIPLDASRGVRCVCILTGRRK